MTDDLSARLAPIMAEAVADALAHVRDGGVPFSALVVDGDGRVLGRGVNRVRARHDPTAHAEIEAIRDACGARATPSLQGAVLLASGEPCALCYLGAFYAGVSRIFYAADRDEAAAHGFDYRGGYRLCAVDPRRWTAPQAGKLAVPDALAPFHACRSGRHAP